MLWSLDIERVESGTLPLVFAPETLKAIVDPRRAAGFGQVKIRVS